MCHFPDVGSSSDDSEAGRGGWRTKRKCFTGDEGCLTGYENEGWGCFFIASAASNH